MKKMNKIFGATAIVGLFLLSSIASASLVGQEPAAPATSEELEHQLLIECLQEEGLTAAEAEQLYLEAVAIEEGQTVPGEEPLGGFLWPDPVPRYANRKEMGPFYKIEVKLKNRGRTFVEPFVVKVQRITWPLVYDYINVLGMIRWGSRTVSTSYKFQIIPGKKHLTIIRVDYFNDLKEGLGELNNLMVRYI